MTDVTSHVALCVSSVYVTYSEISVVNVFVIYYIVRSHGNKSHARFNSFSARGMPVSFHVLLPDPLCLSLPCNFLRILNEYLLRNRLIAGQSEMYLHYLSLPDIKIKG